MQGGWLSESCQDEGGMLVTWRRHQLQCRSMHDYRSIEWCLLGARRRKTLCHTRVLATCLRAD
ncbi:hypothetical protein GQ600_695 [Phytophthora cactorum]|nr:hypothetical protein GQ600_695 [Phytophthora cactorum]